MDPEPVLPFYGQLLKCKPMCKNAFSCVVFLIHKYWIAPREIYYSLGECGHFHPCNICNQLAALCSAQGFLMVCFAAPKWAENGSVALKGTVIYNTINIL